MAAARDIGGVDNGLRIFSLALRGEAIRARGWGGQVGSFDVDGTRFRGVQLMGREGV